MNKFCFLVVLKLRYVIIKSAKHTGDGNYTLLKDLHTKRNVLLGTLASLQQSFKKKYTLLRCVHEC